VTAEHRIRDYHLAELERATQVRTLLGPGSHVGHALTNDVLDSVKRRIESSSESDLTYEFWPFIYCFVLSRSTDAIVEFDADAGLVISRTPASRRNSVTSFLSTSGPRTGVWYGGLFEVWAKATFLKAGTEVHLDVTLPNGRDHDISALVAGRRFHFECTVLTEDDESREVWDRFMEYKRVDPEKVLVRPGPFCPPNAKGPSPYYLPLRLYAKAYDKLSKDLNPEKSQFSDDEPNILLTCFAGPHMSATDPGANWAIEELLANNPRMARTVVPESFTDISLDAWADFRAGELISQRKITVDWYCENSNAVLSAPRRLGGILMFDETRLAGARVNYNARNECAIRHSEMAELERLLSTPASYFR